MAHYLLRNEGAAQVRLTISRHDKPVICDAEGTPWSAWWRVRSRAEGIRRFQDIVNILILPFNIYYKCGIMLI